MNEESLFHEALTKSSRDRAAFLDQACAGQPQLRAAVESLLRAHQDSGELLNDCQLPTATLEYRGKLESGSIIAERYTLVERVGEGGMGEVWGAKQSEPVKRRVALKLIKTGMDSKAVMQRFEHERQALALKRCRRCEWMRPIDTDFYVYSGRGGAKSIASDVRQTWQWRSNDSVKPNGGR